MAGWSRALRFALTSGTVASAASTVALALLARAEGQGLLQPVNATSHWMNGRQAASFRGADIAHTAVGYATHHAATVFWAVLFERWVDARHPAGALALMPDALVLSAIAAAVDYGATPKRFTPGWEFVLSKRSMAVAYLAMATGLAAGASMNRHTGRNRTQ